MDFISRRTDSGVRYISAVSRTRWRERGKTAQDSWRRLGYSRGKTDLPILSALYPYKMLIRVFKYIIYPKALLTFWKRGTASHKPSLWVMRALNVNGMPDGLQSFDSFVPLLCKSVNWKSFSHCKSLCSSGSALRASSYLHTVTVGHCRLPRSIVV